MRGRIRSLTLRNRTDRHGKTSPLKARTDEGRENTSIPHDHPRASSRINDNYWVTSLQARLLAGSTHKETLTFQDTVVNLYVVNHALSATRHPQRKGISPGLAVVKNRSYIKICQRCFFCHSIVLCPTCGQCPSCCKNPACRVQTSKLLANLAGARGRFENSSNLERGLHPSFPDLANSYKVSDCRKPLCQSPQEQLPVGGITSAYRQKCSRIGPQSNISGVLQATISSPKTQQQMEANTGPKQSKPFPQGGEIQNGDTGNHQNIPPARGVGHLSRFQRCLLPHSNTGTIQEISKIPCPGPDLSIQGTALWSVHSAHGVHCISKRGETDGHAQGYKDPPVPRRLVGESQIPAHLSPTYPNPGQNVPGPRLAGEFREIRAGAQTGIRLCRLPVRSQVQPGQTDSGPVAKPSGQDTSTFITAGLSGPAVHVLDRSSNSHRKTGSPRPTTHETHTVASQKHLEGTRISREDYPSTKVPAPSLTVVARGRQCASRPTITPSKTCSANFYRRIKKKGGALT